MEKQILDLPFGIRKRLHYLEFKLFWEGRANRGDLVTAFGISIPQASADIARYQEFAPQNISYNSSAKFYISTEEFSPVFINPSADAYFSEISYSLPVENNVLLIDNYVGIVPNATRFVQASTLKIIVQAIKNKLKISIDYRSFNNPQSRNVRWISPHAFGFDGFRWHVRAYCHTGNKFKDYVLGRIVSVFDSVDSDVDRKTDLQWFNFFDVILGPDPRLNNDQKQLIAQDYNMVDERMAIKCRIALLGYLKVNLRMDKFVSDRTPEQQQIVIINVAEVDAKLLT